MNGGSRDADGEGPEADPGASASSRVLGEAGRRARGLSASQAPLTLSVVPMEGSERQGHRPRRTKGRIREGGAGRRLVVCVCVCVCVACVGGSGE